MTAITEENAPEKRYKTVYPTFYWFALGNIKTPQIAKIASDALSLVGFPGLDPHSHDNATFSIINNLNERIEGDTTIGVLG